MHERLRARAWRVEREPEAPQPARCRPPRRVLAISHGKVLGEPREEHVPALIAGRSRRIREQSLTRLRRLPVILLQELDDQPPSRVEVRLGRDEASKLSEAHRLVTHNHRVANAAHPAPRPGLGDNLPTFSAREEHVLASAENVLKAIGDELGPTAERILRRRIDEARFFVGGIQEPLDPRKKTDARAIRQFEALLSLLAHPESAAPSEPSRPVFDRMNLSLAVTEAAKAFHTRWRGLLGLDMNPDAPKEHRTRVKALTRRLAEGWTDQYDSLQPVADLRNQLQVQLYLMVQRPVRWEGGEPDDDEKQVLIDTISNAITKKLMELTRRRVSEDVRLGWQEAYAQQGRGSSFTRARIIAADVYDRGAPIPTVSASPDQNRFLKDVASLVAEVAEQLDVILE